MFIELTVLLRYGVETTETNLLGKGLGGGIIATHR